MADSGRVCDLCCHEASQWAVGQCEHPLCLRCAAKLRVLCEQNDCPVCRLKLDTVVVCSEVRPFAELSRHRLPGNKLYGMYFKSKELQTSFESLRANVCTHCSPPVVFRTFKQLRQHLRGSHDLRYCDICLNSLKLFPQEFKTYSLQDLTRHKREGDPDDKSHKGHPICKFCDDRFLDNDALHSHLRTDHFWCHICEGDGRQDYYKNYILLRKHFKEDHYLCEEGLCRDEKLTSVFRSKIDLQAHRASQHSKGLSKAEVKQIRHVELGFSYGRSEGARGRAAHPRSGRASELREQEELAVATALTVSTQSSRDNKRRQKLPSPTAGRRSSPTDTAIQQPPGLTIQQPPGLTEQHADKRMNKPKSKHSSDEGPGLSSADIPNAFEAKIVSSGFDPYSDGTKKTIVVEPGPAKPPGFERLPTPTKKKDDWPEIMSDTTVVDSELTGLPEPAFIYAGPTGAWSSSREKPVQILPVKKQITEPASYPGIEAFPPMTSGPRQPPQSPKVSRKKVESKIVEKIRLILGNDKTKLTQFKTLSGWYRSSEITVEEYMSQCADLFGPNWREIGPQVAEVIPVESKKIELMAYFQPPGFAKPSKSKKSKQASVWGIQGSNAGRQKQLNESDYPSLATASALPSVKVSNGTEAWNIVARS